MRLLATAARLGVFISLLAGAPPAQAQDPAGRFIGRLGLGLAPSAGGDFEVLKPFEYVDRTGRR